mgnify:CR=1 FL=1
MTDTTVTVTEPLKDHLKDVKKARGISSLNETIQSVLDDPVQGETFVEEGNMEKNPAPIKITDYTQAWLRQAKEDSEFGVFEDLLRDRSGASPRDEGEQPIEWEPL